MFKKFEINTNGVDYCVGDVHGCVSRLYAFLAKIKFNPETDRLFSVGDLVNKGPDSENVLDLLNESWFHSVLANHEQMVIDACDPTKPWAENLLFQNGGQWFFKLDHIKQKEIRWVFEALPFMIEVEMPNGTTFGIVHADVPFNDWNKAKERLYQEDEQVKNFLIWDRSRYNGNLAGNVIGVNHVLVGHTPVENVVQENNIIRLDTGAVFLNKFAEFEKGFTIMNMTNFEFISEV